MDYYQNKPKTTTNSEEFVLNEEMTSAFPSEGLFFGKLFGPKIEIPAFIDLLQYKGFCFLYDNEENRMSVNRCIERLVWRLALSLPVTLCDFILYNGGMPGDNFNSHNQIHPKLFDNREHKVLFDSYTDEVEKLIKDTYASVLDRKSAISMKGRNSLAELNESEGDDAKIKYQFIFITDFPHNLSLNTLKTLDRIVKVGASAGIFLIMSWDMSARFDTEGFSNEKFNPSGMLQDMTLCHPNNGRYLIRNSGHDELLNRFVLELDDMLITPEQTALWAEYLNKKVKVKSQVAADIRQACINNETLWSCQSRNGLKIPIGKTDASHFQYFEVSTDENPDLAHALIGGGTGSGKSTFLHDIIANAAWLYSPEELQFILLDMKSVEFGIYKHLPNVQVLSTKSEKAYGANLLSYVCGEINRRKRVFGDAGCKDIKEYNSGQHKVPRILVVIDEFQNLFVQEGAIGNLKEANLSKKIESAFNVILKEGRAFGIHFILATQNASDIPSISSFLQQIKLRVALKLQTKGVFLMQDNPARPDKLNKGEGIYNDNYGGSDANSMFRCAFYGNADVSHTSVIEDQIVSQIVDKTVQKFGNPEPFDRYIYKGGGNATLDENPDVATEFNPNECKIFVGSPMSIVNGDVSFVLKRKKGQNVLIAGNVSSYSSSLFYHIFLQVSKQSLPECKLFLATKSYDNDDSNSSFMNQLDCVTAISDNMELQNTIEELFHQLEERKNDEYQHKGTRMMLVIENSREFRDVLTNTEVRSQLDSLVQEGPVFDIHTVIHVNRYEDFEKTLSIPFDPFGGDPVLSIEDLEREFSIRIELKGIGGNELFANGDALLSPDEEYVANLQTIENGTITPFSIYKHLSS